MNEDDAQCGPCKVEIASDDPTTYKVALPEVYADMKDLSHVRLITLAPEDHLFARVHVSLRH